MFLNQTDRLSMNILFSPYLQGKYLINEQKCNGLYNGLLSGD